jgi:uncharacterized protein (DUF58 family)
VKEHRLEGLGPDGQTLYQTIQGRAGAGCHAAGGHERLGQVWNHESIKRETAAEIAAILAFNAIRNNDKAGAILFTDQVERYIPPKKGSAHVWRLIREIFTFRPEHAGTDLSAAVDFFGKVCRKRTVAFLISDFLTQDFGRASALRIKSAARKHELISVLISDPGEFKLPDGGYRHLQGPGNR